MAATFDASSYVLVDTNAFINLIRSRTRAAELAPYVEGKRIVLSFATIAELRRGAYARDYNDESWRELEAQIAASVPVGVDDRLSREWAALSDEARRMGHALGQNAQAHDAWIAATARLYGLPVLTDDKNFDDFPGLALLPER